jgi:hypothetical protein
MMKSGLLVGFVLFAGCAQDAERGTEPVATGALFLNERVSLVQGGESRFVGGGCMQRSADTGGGRAATLEGGNAASGGDQLAGRLRRSVRWDGEGTAIVDVYDLQQMVESRSYPTSFVVAGMQDEFTIHADGGDFQLKYWGGTCSTP